MCVFVIVYVHTSFLIFENKVTFKRTNSYIVTYHVVVHVSRDQIHSGLNKLYFIFIPFLVSTAKIQRKNGHLNEILVTIYMTMNNH